MYILYKYIYIYIIPKGIAEIAFNFHLFVWGIFLHRDKYTKRYQKGKSKVRSCTGTEALYRPYGT